MSWPEHRCKAQRPATLRAVHRSAEHRRLPRLWPLARPQRPLPRRGLHAEQVRGGLSSRTVGAAADVTLTGVLLRQGDTSSGRPDSNSFPAQPAPLYTGRGRPSRVRRNIPSDRETAGADAMASAAHHAARWHSSLTHSRAAELPARRRYSKAKASAVSSKRPTMTSPASPIGHIKRSARESWTAHGGRKNSHQGLSVCRMAIQPKGEHTGQ